jgi:hypothetical protein
MRKFLAAILGIFFGVLAMWMLALPLHWYANTPGVTETGPANAHLIRDVGCAFLVAALALLWFLAAPNRAWPAVLAVGAFLSLHALVHVWDTAAGREHSHRLLTEIPTVILPAVLALWLGRPPSPSSQSRNSRHFQT